MAEGRLHSANVAPRSSAWLPWAWRSQWGEMRSSIALGNAAHFAVRLIMKPIARQALSEAAFVGPRVATPGSCPQARMNRSKSSRPMLVVAVFSSGWQLILSCCMSSASMTTCTRRLGSLMTANAVTAPGVTPSASISSSGLPKLNRRARNVRASAFSSTRVVLSATMRNNSPKALRTAALLPSIWRWDEWSHG